MERKQRLISTSLSTCRRYTEYYWWGGGEGDRCSSKLLEPYHGYLLCQEATHPVTIPEGVQTIGNSAFSSNYLTYIIESSLGLTDSVDGETSTCSHLSSANLLASSDITPTNPPAGISILGGVDFTIACNEPSENQDDTPSITTVAYTLGDKVPDNTKLRIYKYSSTTSKLTDITSLVNITNQTIDGKTNTVITYSLLDGGELDEDGEANGIIVDPIVIGYAGDIEGGRLAETGVSQWLILAAGAIIAGLGVVVLRGRRAR